MEDGVSRRDAARELGLTYSTLRVYERELEGLLPLAKGPNRTTLYTTGALEVLRRAVELKRSGLPFSKLSEYFHGQLAPEGSPASALDRIRVRTEEILSINQRIEERLEFFERQYRALLRATAPTAGVEEANHHA